jgi:hypothetical protein
VHGLSLASNLGLQITLNLLQIRASADKLLVDVDVGHGALSVEVFEVRLNLGC